MNEPIYSMLTGKPCGTRTAICEFGDAYDTGNFIYHWVFTSNFPAECSNCPNGWTSPVTPGGEGVGNISDACGTCSSTNEGEICTINYNCQ
jgi:hypothetical protein